MRGICEALQRVLGDFDPRLSGGRRGRGLPEVPGSTEGVRGGGGTGGGVLGVGVGVGVVAGPPGEGNGGGAAFRGGEGGGRGERGRVGGVGRESDSVHYRMACERRESDERTV